MNMKFALAAGVCAAALAGFSDVTSANVVGYMEQGTLGSGNKMITPSFESVSSMKTFKLSDLKGTETEDAGGDLSLTVLTPGGSGAKFTQEDADANPALQKYVGREKKFYWYAGGWRELKAGWYDSDGEEVWDAENIIVNPGDGFWTLGYTEAFVFPAPKLKD